MRIGIPAELSAIALLGGALRGLLGELGCEHGQAGLVELAAVEVATNAVKHGLEGRLGMVVEVELGLEGRELRVAVFDSGTPIPDGAFAAARAKLEAPPSETPEESGYGLGLVMQIMDHIDYRPGADRNVFAMTLVLIPRPA